MHEYNEEDIVVFVSLSSFMCVRYSEGHPDARPGMKKGRWSIGLLKSQPYSSRPSVQVGWGAPLGSEFQTLKSVSVHLASVKTGIEAIVGVTGLRITFISYMLQEQEPTIPRSGNYWTQIRIPNPCVAGWAGLTRASTRCSTVLQHSLSLSTRMMENFLTLTMIIMNVVR